MTGESYAGKYLPLFTHEILEYNDGVGPEAKISLATTLIIDPYVSPVLQRTHMHMVPYGLGVLDDNNMNQVSAIIQNCHKD